MNPCPKAPGAGCRRSRTLDALLASLLFLVVAAPRFALGAVGPGDAVPESGAFSWSRFLGAFHMLVVHLPIGFVVSAVAVEAHTWWARRRDGYASTHFMVMLAILSGLVAAFLGVLHAAEGGFDAEAVDGHRWAGFVLLGVLGVTAVASWRSIRSGGDSGSRVTVRVLLGVAVLLTGATGHLGGSLTHGSGFLAANAPPMVARFLGGHPAAGMPEEGGAGTAAPAGSGRSDFAQVWQVLESRCQSCHGAEKHKGGLRLDEKAAMLKGGDSGVPAVVPGDPLKSRLMHVLLLPRDHDEAMPPAGKEGLSPEEIVRIAHWIHAGAP